MVETSTNKIEAKSTVRNIKSTEILTIDTISSQSTSEAPVTERTGTHYQTSEVTTQPTTIENKLNNTNEYETGITVPETLNNETASSILQNETSTKSYEFTSVSSDQVTKSLETPSTTPTIKDNDNGTKTTDISLKRITTRSNGNSESESSTRKKQTMGTTTLQPVAKGSQVKPLLTL